jgi:hypothetical protein
MKDLEAAFVTEVDNHAKDLEIKRITRNNEIDNKLIETNAASITKKKAALEKETDPEKRIKLEIDIQLLGIDNTDLKAKTKERDEKLT